jgi:signal transduction histidine kinase
MIFKANRVLINVLVRNLIENAIKYSPSNSTIQILLKQDDNQLCLEVCDQGQGVPEEDLIRLTQRFYRHEQSSDTRGTGLGLSIVQKIFDLHDGKITFQNRPTGGLSVNVYFPNSLN